MSKCKFWVVASLVARDNGFGLIWYHIYCSDCSILGILVKFTTFISSQIYSNFPLKKWHPHHLLCHKCLNSKQLNSMEADRGGCRVARPPPSDTPRGTAVRRTWRRRRVPISGGATGITPGGSGHRGPDVTHPPRRQRTTACRVTMYPDAGVW